MYYKTPAVTLPQFDVVTERLSSLPPRVAGSSIGTWVQGLLALIPPCGTDCFSAAPPRTTAVRNAKLPGGDLGNHDWITGTGCANLYDLARDAQQVQSADKGEVEDCPFRRS